MEDAEVSKEELCLLWGCCFLCWDYTGQGSQSSRKILRRTCQYPWPLTPLNLKSIKINNSSNSEIPIRANPNDPNLNLN